MRPATAACSLWPSATDYLYRPWIDWSEACIHNPTVNKKPLIIIESCTPLWKDHMLCKNVTESYKPSQCSCLNTFYRLQDDLTKFILVEIFYDHLPSFHPSLCAFSSHLLSSLSLHEQIGWTVLILSDTWTSKTNMHQHNSSFIIHFSSQANMRDTNAATFFCITSRLY